jgi:hypothetical protein
VRAARFVLVLGLAAIAAGAFAQEPHRASAAMHVATLAERAGKLQAQVGQGVLVERSRRSLAEALRELEGLLQALERRAPSAEIRDNYVLLGLLAQEYRPAASRPATRDNARKLAERTEEIAWVAAKNARLAEERLRTPAGTLALHASEAGMLSQRVARLQLLRHWGIREESMARELAAALGELGTRLQQLAGDPRNTAAISAEVEVSQSQFMFLAQAARDLEAGKAVARQAEFIAKSADHILESMQRAARLYEALAP